MNNAPKNYQRLWIEESAQITASDFVKTKVSDFKKVIVSDPKKINKMEPKKKTKKYKDPKQTEMDAAHEEKNRVELGSNEAKRIR
jgi:hypothetical protein